MTNAEQNISLMDGFKAHQTIAEKKIFDLFYAPLCLYAAEITVDIQQAEDIVTEAFKKSFDRRDEFLELENLKAFLYKIVRNASINLREKQKNRQSIHVKIAAEQAQDMIDYGDVNKLEILRVELLHEIYKEVINLPKQCKIVFEKIFYEGLSTNQVAAELNLSVNTVRAQKARAIQLLKTQLLKSGKMEAILLLAGLIEHLK